MRKANDQEVKFPWGELILDTGIGYTFGSLPDWVEPATNPHHRKFFHSLTTAGLVTYGAFGKHAHEWSDEVRRPIQSVAVTYISHLAADATTDRGIAVIHPKVL